MMPVLFSLLSLRSSFRARASLQLEILAPRHQLLILGRANRKQRLELSAADRTLWVWLSRFWPGWRSALLIVKPETVIAWHRKGFRLYWTWKSRVPNGRPLIPPPTTYTPTDPISDPQDESCQSTLGHPAYTASCSSWVLKCLRAPWRSTWSVIGGLLRRPGGPF